MATTEQSPKKLERKAAAKEEIVNATSGAREIVDHAAFNARAVGKILLHPFDKDAKAEAIAKAREDKAASGQKMASIRDIGAQQADALRLSARGMQSPEAGSAWDTTDAPPSSPHDVQSPEQGNTPPTDAKSATTEAAAPVPADHDRA